jgi:hypothetical protein
MYERKTDSTPGQKIHSSVLMNITKQSHVRIKTKPAVQLTDTSFYRDFPSIHSVEFGTILARFAHKLDRYTTVVDNRHLPSKNPAGLGEQM